MGLAEKTAVDTNPKKFAPVLLKELKRKKLSFKNFTGKCVNKKIKVKRSHSENLDKTATKCFE